MKKIMVKKSILAGFIVIVLAISGCGGGGGGGGSGIIQVQPVAMGGIYGEVCARAWSARIAADYYCDCSCDPVEGAVVAVQCGNKLKSTVTDGDGEFEINDLPAVECSVAITKKGFDTYRTSVTVVESDTTPVGTRRGEVGLELSVAGSVQIISSIKGADIYIDGESTCKSIPSGLSYTVENLPPGQHEICLWLSLYDVYETKWVTVAENQAGEAEYQWNVPEISEENIELMQYMMMPSPAPPEISDVALALQGNDIVVSAILTAHTQKMVDTDNPDRMVADPDVSPNPPSIQMARLYYFFNGAYNSQNYKTMEYNESAGRWESTIPEDEFDSGDELTYYVAAADTAGNVASEIPGTVTSGNVTLSGWNANLATPAMTVCGFGPQNPLIFPPSLSTLSCNNQSTVNDDLNDLYPASGGCAESQSVSVQSDEILGFSAVMTQNMIYVRSHNTTTAVVSGGPIEGYFAYFSNPDAADADPDDMHFAGAYSVGMYPEAQGADCGYFCDTQPDQFDLECVTEMYVNIPDLNNGLEFFYDYLHKCIIYKQGLFAMNDYQYMLFGIERNGVIGGSSSSVIIFIANEDINLSGDYPMRSYTDITPGLRLYVRNYQYTIN